MEKLLVAKQASDLHTSTFCQHVLYRYLMDNDLDAHLEVIRSAYGAQRDAMVEAIQKYFPNDVVYTEPEGGMFLWVTLPGSVSTLDLFHRALEEGVAFVPGHPFYVDREETNTLRLNFSCMDEATIDVGIQRLAKAFEEV